jgi:hypothetical protein
MLAVVVMVAAAALMEMEVVTAKELDRPAATRLQAMLVERVAATVVASLKVSLKVQALELGLVLASELDRQVALALMVQAMPLESVEVAVAAQVAATTAGQAAAQAPDLDLVPVDILKYPFLDKLKPESKHSFLVSSLHYSTSVKFTSFLCF